MKTINTLLLGLIFVSFVGCTKESSEDMQPSSSHNSEYLILSDAEYDALQDNLINDFDNNKNTVNKRDIQVGDLGTVLDFNGQTEPKTIDSRDLIRQNKEVTSKYPILNTFTSMLDIYHQALLITDKDDLIRFVEPYKDYLYVLDEFNFVMPKKPRYRLAMINPNGLVQIGKKIIKYEEYSIKIIEDGDKSKISLLSSIKKSKNNITVISFESNSSKDKHTAQKVTTIYHPNSTPGNNLAIGMINYIDYLGSTLWDVGTEAAVFYNGSPTYASYFNLDTYTYYVPPYNQAHSGSIVVGTTNYTKNRYFGPTNYQNFKVQTNVIAVVGSYSWGGTFTTNTGTW